MPQYDQGLSKGQKRYHFIPRVLVFLTHKDKVLLIKGAPEKRNWANLYNGLGGHVEHGESIFEAAKREVREESGLQIENLWLCAVVTIDVTAEGPGILMFVLRGESTDGEAMPSNEGELVWVRREELAEFELVEDLPILLPLVLDVTPEEAPLWGHYWYDDKGHLRTDFR